MINRITILILIFLYQPLDSQIQIDSLLLSQETDTSLLQIKLDAIGNLWKIYPTKIIRISEEESFRDSFSSRIITRNTTIDSKFPLKNLFYNPNTNKIYIVNSRWGALSELKLDLLGIYQPVYVNYSSDGTIWILDRNTNQLYRINENGTKKAEAPNPYRIGGKIFFPQYSIDQKSYTIAVDSSYGYFILDDFGSLTYSSQIPLDGKLILHSEYSFIQKADKLYLVRIDDKTFEMKSSKNYIDFKEPIINLVYSNQKIIIRTSSNKLFYYKNFIQLFRQ